MKCLAIADLFINAAMMESGLKALRDNGIEVEVREWSHGSVEKLQEDNLRLNRKEQKPWPYRKRCFRERMILTS